MSKSDRGFASMSPTRQREIARKGGLAAHAKGTAHRWTSEEAQVAGRKGGSRPKTFKSRAPAAVGPPPAAPAPSAQDPS